MPKLPVNCGNRRLGFDLLLDNLLVWKHRIRYLTHLPFFNYSVISLDSLPLLPALPPLQHCSSSASRSQRLLPRIWPGVFADAAHALTQKTWGEVWSPRIQETTFTTLLPRIWRPPFSAFQALHFQGTFEGGSSQSWSRGRAQPPPCAAGNGPDQSGPPIHPIHLLL